MKLKDLKNQKIGRLTIAKIAFRKGKHIYWECLCDCGKIKYNSTTNLVSGKVLSCGCFRREISRTSLSLIPRRKLELGEGSCNYLYNRYVQTAKKHKNVFTIDRDLFRKITSMPCHYCGDEPNRMVLGSGSNGEYFFNGIDRKNSKIGYTPENILPACRTCNYAKNDMEYGEFLLWIERLIKFKTYKYADNQLS